MKTPGKKCKGSGETQMLSWLPEGDYPGAVVCLGCARGILIKQGSAHEAVSETGVKGMAGVVRDHGVP